MICFLGIEYQERGILYFVNVGVKTTWSKFVTWERPQRSKAAAERKMKKVAAGYLAESVRRDIAAMVVHPPKIRMPRPCRRAV